jgi:hypothetical protein
MNIEVFVLALGDELAAVIGVYCLLLLPIILYQFLHGGVREAVDNYYLAWKSAAIVTAFFWILGTVWMIFTTPM